MPTAQIDNADDEVKQTLARGNSLRFAADVPRCHRVVGARDSQRHSPDEAVSDPIEDAALQGWIVQVMGVAVRDVKGRGNSHARGVHC